MVKSGKPAKPKGPAFFAGRVRASLADKSVRDKYAEELRRNTVTARQGFWNFRRSLRKYSIFFGVSLCDFLGRNVSIVDAIVSLRPKGQTVRLLEDGAGAAVALSELKKEIEARGVKCEATALGIHHKELLADAVAKGRINQFVVKPGELFVPKKPVDAIISVLGSIDYALREHRKDTLLKFAYSLRRNGLLLAGFTGYPFNPRESSERSEEKMQVQFRHLEKSFVKRGFRARVYRSEGDLTMPDWILIVQRVK